MLEIAYDNSNTWRKGTILRVAAMDHDWAAESFGVPFQVAIYTEAQVPADIATGNYLISPGSRRIMPFDWKGYFRFTLNMTDYGAEAHCPICEKYIAIIAKRQREGSEYFYRVNPDNPADAVVYWPSLDFLESDHIEPLTKELAEGLRDEWAGKAPDSSGMTMQQFRNSKHYKDAKNI